MIGDVKVMSNKFYFQANSNGTLVKLHETSWWRKRWLRIRDKFKKWDQHEAVEFAKKGNKTCKAKWGKAKRKKHKGKR